MFYPGDALTVPGVEVPTLLVPTNAPWLKLRGDGRVPAAVRPGRAYSTHDGLLNEIGPEADRQLAGMEADKQKADIRRLPVGESVDAAR